MMDIDDGYILWTGIWKGTVLKPCVDLMIQITLPSLAALGNSKGASLHQYDG